jgi:chemotaxis family two-component system response regulator PixG
VLLAANLCRISVAGFPLEIFFTLQSFSMQTQQPPSMRVIQRASLPALFSKLLTEKVTGRLVVTQPAGESSFYFVSGRFLFAFNEVSRVRRWYRTVERFCPDLKTSTLQEPQHKIPWEYQLLCQELTQKRISQQQSRSILVTIAQEVLFPLLWTEEVSCAWLPMTLNCSLLACIPFDQEVLKPMQTLTMRVMHHGTKLATQLEFAPAWIGPATEASSESLQELVGLLDGQHGFWDLVAKTEHGVAPLIRQIDKLQHRNWVEFRSLVDLDAPVVAGSTSGSAATTQPKVEAAPTPAPKAGAPPRPLIACIDDSKAMCQVLEKMLIPAGYDVLKIHSPLEEMATLVSREPHLLLLDLMMPDIDGFSLFMFLRKTPVFKDTPIIILTSSSGIINRTKALSVGACGFLSKPPDQELLLATLKKYLPN